MIPRFSVASVGYSLFFVSIITLADSAEPGKPIYEVAAGSYRRIGKDSVSKNWSKGVGKSASKKVISMWPLQNSATVPKLYRRVRVAIAHRQVGHLSIRREDGHLGGLSWMPALTQAGRLVLAQQDYDRDLGPPRTYGLIQKFAKLLAKNG